MRWAAAQRLAEPLDGRRLSHLSARICSVALTRRRTSPIASSASCSAPSSACCRASGRSPRSRCCCRSRSRWQPESAHDHARRHLLRRAVWRLDHRDPGQHPGRGLVRRHHHRRPPDGAQGPRRASARHRGDRLVLCRLRRDAADRVRGAAAGRHRAAIRAGGIFLADGVRPDCRRGAGARLAGQGDRAWWSLGSAARPRRHRCEFRDHAASISA